jgi:hypothetical protein
MKKTILQIFLVKLTLFLKIRRVNRKRETKANETFSDKIHGTLF